MIDSLKIKVLDAVEDRLRIYFDKNEFPTEQFVGEIIGIQRDGYYHYGIYVGNNKVVHYTSLDDDISDDNEIMETNLDGFFRKNDKLFVIKVEEWPSLFDQIRGYLILKTTKADIKQEPIQIFSPEETVKRAYERLNEKNYCLKTNNCEHFAYWAKMGLPISDQVKNTIFAVGGITLLGGLLLFITSIMLNNKKK